MLLYTVFAVRAVITLLTRTTSTDCTVLGVSCSAPPAGLIGLLHAMLGGILGAGVLGMVKFHRWVSVRNSFDVRHTWGYLFAPVLGGVLGLVVFALLQSGLLIFSGKPSSDTGLVTNLGYLAVGFLSGFGWDSATRRIETIITKFFSDAQAPKAQHDTVDGSSNIEASVTADRE
ncbi:MULTISPECIES: hypothetical protein [unclassified Mycobacterium]|uniref:hypothetical protein n=1 Tax=unclassified Mycobacterium TaxID=2642494 RepID=UPI0012E98D80|nr:MULTISPECIES: hypothetical protein [unclassified Mycobacterium]